MSFLRTSRNGGDAVNGDAEFTRAAEMTAYHSLFLAFAGRPRLSVLETL